MFNHVCRQCEKFGFKPN